MDFDSMNKTSLLGVVAAFVVVTVLIAGCTSGTSPNTVQTQTAGTGKASTPSAAQATPTPGNTTLIITSPTQTTDLYVGDRVTTTGRLVDSKGIGIPNQTITFKSIAHVLGFSTDHPNDPVTTDSTGNFTRVETISAQGAPSFISTVSVEGWIEYAGNALYKPTATPHKTITVHLN
jgi:hypothetical protein